MGPGGLYHSRKRLGVSQLQWTAADPGAGLHTWDRFSKLPYPGDKAFLYDTFPDKFMWAVGTAAYSVEGAWEKDGKGKSIWDTFTRGGTRVSRGDVGSDSYHNIPGDLRALQQLGVSHYRFSLSWPRIFSNGTKESYNKKGVEYYKNLIRGLKEIKVLPVVTLYHWDLPDSLQTLFGGWSNLIMVELFREYADFCFKTFGSDVKFWITIDNPFVVAWHGYGTGVVAPGIKNDSDLPFRVGHNLLKAHAAAWHLYDDRYRSSQGGRVSMALASHWIKPSRTRQENSKACQCSLDFVLGWFAHPLFVDGDYPPCMKRNLTHRLPSFTETESLYVNGTADFFALSHGPALSFQLINDSLLFGQTEDLCLRMLLYWVRAEYNNPPIFVVESGWYGSGNTKTKDAKHMYYLKRFIMETLKAIRFDRVNVIGYTAWSLLDGYEWYREYGIRRGLFYVDFNSPDLKREPKTSATFYSKLIEKNGFPQLPENRPEQGVFPCDFAWGVAANSIQVDTIPTQFADPSVYIWNISGNGELTKVPGVLAPPMHRTHHCADYGSILQQVSDVHRMQVSHFHFSLNWSSITPTGQMSDANETLLRYYHCFVSELQKVNIIPVVTLWHHTGKLSSLPAPIEAGGGWQSEETVQAFAKYARLCFQRLGAHVKLWITLNEPNDEDLEYTVGHQLLRAHALAWHVYDSEFRKAQGGKASLVLHMDWVEPAFSFNREDVEPANRVLDFRVGWFAEPIFGSGDYPAVMRSWLQQRNNIDLFNYHLPVFSDEDRLLVKGTYDFFAISHFTTSMVYDGVEDKYTFKDKLQVQLISDVTWIMSPRRNSPVVPWGLRKALNWVNSRYKGLPIYVMANGVQEDIARFKDSLRVYYLYNYINEALKAYTLDGVNLKGYFAYAFSDRRDPGFGMYGHVQEEVISKSSLAHYKNIIHHNGFPAPGTSQQQCPLAPVHGSGRFVLTKQPVVGFLSLVSSCMLITVGLVIYYSVKRHKLTTKK
ncbi:klotho-like [Sinocyclocheilus rhinocerous]|uniref:klotho-like n=1 Tax=Sinocyclocheilus rhinocerous TaxID=307959 RepID=UPI0007B9057E|nr:PREDICTED: klotho-like [Sinocyclocheilus rhinocerous]